MIFKSPEEKEALKVDIQKAIQESIQQKELERVANLRRQEEEENRLAEEFIRHVPVLIRANLTASEIAVQHPKTGKFLPYPQQRFANTKLPRVTQMVKDALESLGLQVCTVEVMSPTAWGSGQTEPHLGFRI